MTVIRFADAPRDVVIAQGDDAETFLHSQLAQDVGSLQVGSSKYSMILEPTGHITVVCRVVRHADTVFTLDVEQGFGESIIERLKKFILRSKVTLRMSDWSCRSFRGVGAGTALSGVTGAAHAWWGSTQWVDVIAPPHDVASVGESMSVAELEEMRVDAGWPRLGVDYQPGDVPAATGLVHFAASFTKGCYPGQELVERMDSRRTDAPVRVRHLDGGFVVGEEIVINGETIGVVTSASGRHALARIKRGAEIGRALGAGAS